MPTFLKSLVVVYCSDIQASAHFYGEILGLETCYRFPKIGEPEHIEYKIRESVIGISSFKGLQSHGLPVEVSDIPSKLD
ncbi:MAG: VOC family protein [Cytophagaceae bacterium]|nr:VOC family protein [Cytophagaceae bacterium]